MCKFINLKTSQYSVLILDLFAETKAATFLLLCKEVVQINLCNLDVLVLVKSRVPRPMMRSTFVKKLSLVLNLWLCVEYYCLVKCLCYLWW